MSKQAVKDKAASCEECKRRIASAKEEETARCEKCSAEEQTRTRSQRLLALIDDASTAVKHSTDHTGRIRAVRLHSMQEA